MTSKNSIIQALEIIKGKKIYKIDFENGTFECGAAVFSFELNKSGLIRSNSVKFLWLINEFKTNNKIVTQDLQTDNKKAPVETRAVIQS